MQQKEHPTKRWITAVKQWNEQQKITYGFVIPKRGSPEYLQVKAIEREILNQQQRVDGFVVEREKILVKFE